MEGTGGRLYGRAARVDQVGDGRKLARDRTPSPGRAGREGISLTIEARHGGFYGPPGGFVQA